MTKKERQQLKDLHDLVANKEHGLLAIYKHVYYIRNEMKINGVDGTAPVYGIEAGIEYLNSNQHRMTKEITELKSVTQSLRANKNLLKALKEFLKAHPVLLKVLGFIFSSGVITTILKILHII